MDSVLTSVTATALFISIAAAIGYRLSRSAKPYGAIGLLAHMVLFSLATSGVFSSIYKLHSVEQHKLLSTFTLYLTGLTLLINFVVGIAMIIVSPKSTRLISIHKLSTATMATAIVASIFFLVIKI
jgi:hypothetical protein